MKWISSVALMLICMSAFGQFPLEKRWRLERASVGDDEFFNRKNPVQKTSRITVDFQTSDEVFNKRMNVKPHDYFKLSEITFLRDSTFVRVGTSTANGNFRTEYSFGTFSTKADTNLIYFNVQAPQKTVVEFNYSIVDSTLRLMSEKANFWAEYTLQAQKIENEFKAPWENHDNPLLIDAYHLNDIDWNQLLQDRKVAGIIHKASQGLTVDPKYSERKEMAQIRKYKWGSYHLGTNEDPIKQAEFYYELTKGDSTELCCLDLEDVNAKDKMNLKQAKKFIERWHELTGNYPVLYCNKNVLMQIDAKYGRKSVFAKCPLWYARFREEIPDWKPETWDTYTFWQFCSEINCKKGEDCLYDVRGCAHDIDVNVFNGTFYEMIMFWPNF